MRISDWSSDVCSSDLVFRIQAKHKSFIIGDVPGAEAPFPRPDGTKSPPMLFLPLTWDIAVAIIGGGRRVEVDTVDRDQVRAMSVATAARAMTIAGRSEELVNSLVTGVPYSGVVIDRGMGDDGAAQGFARLARMGEIWNRKAG